MENSHAPRAGSGLPESEYKGQNDAMGPVFKYWGSMAELGIIRVFIKYKVFDAIPEEGDISFVELAEITGAQVSLLERFSNFLIAVGILASPAPGRVAITKLSAGYRSRCRPAMLFVHAFDYLLVPVAQWPQYFDLNGFAEPQQANRVPISLAMGQPDKTFYEILDTMPQKAAVFNQTMAAASQGMPITGMYDFKWVGDHAATTNGEHASASNEGQASAVDSEAAAPRPLLVDVAGGKGQALKAILAENPQIPASRCVLFDRADVIQDAERENDAELAPVRKVAGSFHEAQPIKGALIYHIRRALNDWPDGDVLKILGHLRAACAPDSRVLVSEQLLLSPPTVFNSLLDIFTMNFGGKRRSESMYSELASQVGLRVSSVSKDTKGDTAVIEMVPI